MRDAISILERCSQEETEQIDNKEEITEERQKSALNSAGIYSVLNDEWIKEPEQADIPEIDQAELDKLVQPWIDRYNEIKKIILEN